MTSAECGVRNAELNNSSQDSALAKRTKQFAIDVIQFVEQLPKGRTADVIARQLLRAGTSVGANYRSACRAKSRADFVAKMGIVEEEADETSYWFELLVEAHILPQERVADLMKASDAIVAMSVASIRTARGQRHA